MEKEEKVFMSKQMANEMLHYLKINQDVISKDIKNIIDNADFLCPFSSHEKQVDILLCYNEDEQINILKLYLKRYIQRFEFLDISHDHLDIIKKAILIIEDCNLNDSLKNFKDNLNQILRLICYFNEIIFKEINKLTCLESIRLDESLNALYNDCLLSSIIMAVSAVEARLHYLIEKKDKKLYEENFKKSTLGTVIKLFFDENSFSSGKFIKLKNMIPNEHNSLMNLLNTYRIFSAHPIRKNISFRMAKIIVSLCFEFLLDERVKIEDHKLLLHKD